MIRSFTPNSIRDTCRIRGFDFDSPMTLVRVLGVSCTKKKIIINVRAAEYGGGGNENRSRDAKTFRWKRADNNITTKCVARVARESACRLKKLIR